MSTQRRRVLEGDGGMTTITNDGVYIEGLDGKFYTVGNWKGGYYDTNSIVVASGDVKFRIALEWKTRRFRLNSNNTDPLENYMTVLGLSEAKVDYNGAGNTANILKLIPSKDYAAGYCNKFTFPDGKTKGYLPSLGQLNLVYQNKDVVGYALRKCGGAAMATASYWSSTFYGINVDYRYCWYLDWENGNLYFSSLTNPKYVLPFADLD